MNKNNELMNQGRISESIHPVYKWQDASRTPSPGGRAATPARSSPPVSPARGGQSPPRLGSAAGRATCGACRASACGTVLAFPRQRLCGCPASRGATSHFPLTHCRGICVTHDIDSIAAQSGSVLPPKKKKKVCFPPSRNYLISSNTFAMI